MAQRKLIHTAERLRKIGERIEEITVELSPDEIDAAKNNVVDLHGRRENLIAAAKSVAAEYKSKIGAVERQMNESARAATTHKQRKEITIAEWLTAGRQVVRVRADTDSVIDSRDARADELQEALFDASKADLDPRAELAFPPPDEAFGQ